MLDDIKVGDKILRIMQGYREELWCNSGTVTQIDDKVITCSVYVDVPRTMRFNRSDGVNVKGREYGWLGKESPIDYSKIP